VGKREPNERLTLLYREAGLTMRQFAQAVNRLGTERGTPTRYREPSVHQWLAGHMPRETARPLIVQALARRLHRPITLDQAGFPAPLAPTGEHSLVAGLIDLGRQDMERRTFLEASLFSVAMQIPEWHDSVGRLEALRSGDVRSVGMTDVELVTRMTDRLWGVFEEFGGCHTRPLAAHFLVTTVAPGLRTGSSEASHRAMLSAAAFLCYLTGWMAEDEALHGLAQRYYTKGLELAREAGDHLTYCHVLRGMSVQAADLGHGRDAVRLGDAAASAAPRTGPRLRAFFTAQQGYAAAVAGEKRTALHHIRETEKSLDIADSGTTSFGGFDHSTLAYATSQVRFHLRDVNGSVDSLTLHFRLRDASDTTRSALRFGSLLAERQLAKGHLEEACATWQRVLDGYPQVRSGRVDRHVAQIPRLLRPYERSRTARETCERARRATSRTA
jgi:hypothetical protein